MTHGYFESWNKKRLRISQIVCFDGWLSEKFSVQGPFFHFCKYSLLFLCNFGQFSDQACIHYCSLFKFCFNAATHAHIK